MKYLIAVIVLAFLFSILFVLTTWPMGSIPSLGSYEFARLVYNLRTPLSLLLGVGFIVLLMTNVIKNKRLRPIAHPLLTLALLVSISISWVFDANRIFRILESPDMVAADTVALPPDLPLLSVTQGDVSHAYPLQYLAYHHLISDRVGDRQLDITYCVLVDSASAFVKAPDTSLELIAARGNNSIYRDRQTGSWWQQQTGQSVAGERTGTALPTVDTERLTFSQWREQYPEGRIMVPEPEYQALYSQFFPGLWPE
jgi:hypothetical protein